MYIGRYYHQLEEKGRVSLPKKFRTNESLIITRGLDGGLYLYPETQWTKTIQELTTRSDTKRKNRDYLRLMTNDAQELETDKLGRIMIPEYLRNFAHLTKQVVIIGSYAKIEIWNVETYHEYLDQIEGKMEEIAESIELTEMPA
ncbi:MAG: division/cell wall cluster transcriptional repressor MraZ [Patescibacteria group bacterium]